MNHNSDGKRGRGLGARGCLCFAAVLTLLAIAWAWLLTLNPKMVYGAAYSFEVELPGGRVLWWQQYEALRRATNTVVSVRDGTRIARQVEGVLDPDRWLTDASFWMAPDGQTVCVTTQDADSHWRDHANPVAEHLVAKVWPLTPHGDPSEFCEFSYELNPREKRAPNSILLARWMLLDLGEPRVLLHWSPRFRGTRLCYRPRAGHERGAIIIETSDRRYVSAISPHGMGTGVLLLLEGRRASVCGWLDTKHRQFLDGDRYVWTYSQGGQIARSAAPLRWYPMEPLAWADEYNAPEMKQRLK